MRTAGANLGLVLVGLMALTACWTGEEDDGCIPLESFMLSDEEYCPLACTSWSNLVVTHLPWDTPGRFTLRPDYSVSPPRAEVSVGQRFSAYVAHPNRQPADCNEGFDGPYTFRSTDQAVIAALNGEGVSGVLAAVYEAVGPGTAHVIVHMPTPSGPSEPVPLTVCIQPADDQVACPNRAILVVRVVP